MVVVRRSVLLAFVYVHHLRAWCPRRLKKEVLGVGRVDPLELDEDVGGMALVLCKSSQC